ALSLERGRRLRILKRPAAPLSTRGGWRARRKSEATRANATATRSDPSPDRRHAEAAPGVLRGMPCSTLRAFPRALPRSPPMTPPDSTPPGASPASPPDAGAPRVAAGLTLVLGGARSGKSRHAEALLAAAPPPWIYVATAEAGDAEMATRIAEHRRRRDKRWQTVEAPRELASALSAL